MTETETTILPVSRSASGDNAMIISCLATQGMMQYASCLARLGALDAPGVNVPSDWNQCGTARENNRCEAAKMRAEEHLKGRSIYFKARMKLGQFEGTQKRTWGSKPVAIGVSAHSIPVVMPTEKKPASMLDAIGSATLGYEAALSAAKPPVKTAKPPTTPPTKPAKAPRMPMLPGESPLAYARRLFTLQTD